MAQQTKERAIPPFLASKDSEPGRIEYPVAIETIDYRTFGITKEGQRSYVLKILFKNGITAIFSYNKVSTPIFFDGGSKLTIPITKGTIQITGENIGLLADYIGHQRLVWIKEAHRDDKMVAKDGEILVTTIVYKDANG